MRRVLGGKFEGLIEAEARKLTEDEKRQRKTNLQLDSHTKIHNRAVA